MDVFLPVIITGSVVAFLIFSSGRLKVRLALAPIGLISLGWLGLVSLGVIKLHLGCPRMFGDCYGTEFDGDIGIAGSLAGMLIILGWVVGGMVSVALLIRRRRGGNSFH